MSLGTCVFCNSTSFGPGCPFSSHRRHFHAGDAKHCCWCGSTAVGPGCPFNPFGRNHVHGVDFNAMIRDSVEKSIITSYLMQKLAQPITETKAYKLGIIDKSGNKIRKPQTLEEQNSFTYLDEYVVNLKQALGNKIDMINSVVKLNVDKQVTIAEFTKLNENKMQFETKIKRISEELRKTIISAYNEGLSSSMIESIIIENMIEK